MSKPSFGGFGKNLPQHELMRSLLMAECPRRRRIDQTTQSTQTSPRRFSEQSLSKKHKSHSARNFNHSQQKKNAEYLALLASLKQRIVQMDIKDSEEDSCCCCCCGDDDDWSNYSDLTSSRDVHFPRETRNAMLMLQSGDKRRKNSNSNLNLVKPPPPPPPPFCAWAEGQKKFLCGEMKPKISARLSKHRLN